MTTVDYRNTEIENLMRDLKKIELGSLFRLLFKFKFSNIAIIICFTLFSIFYALSLPNIYKSEALYVSSVSGNQSGLGGLANQLGGLAAIGGINLGDSSNEQTVIALEILKSRQFLIQFIQKYQLKIPLFAWEGWDLTTNEPIYDDSIFDLEQNKWIRNVKFPKTPEPSNLEAYFEIKEILKVSKDESTGLISVSIEHLSPVLTKEWINNLVELLNQDIRLRERNEAESSIVYLNKQLENTNLTNNKTVIYQLLEEQLKKLMLTEVRKEYAFKVIDPSYIPEVKSNPNRPLLVVLGLVLGLLSSILVTILRVFLMGRYSLFNK